LRGNGSNPASSATTNSEVNELRAMVRDLAEELTQLRRSIRR
jgi:hypothetical protein